VYLGWNFSFLEPSLAAVIHAPMAANDSVLPNVKKTRLVTAHAHDINYCSRFETHQHVSR